jgi:hypothetical protein
MIINLSKLADLFAVLESQEIVVESVYLNTLTTYILFSNLDSPAIHKDKEAWYVWGTEVKIDNELPIFEAKVTGEDTFAQGVIRDTGNPMKFTFSDVEIAEIKKNKYDICNFTDYLNLTNLSNLFNFRYIETLRIYKNNDQTYIDVFKDEDNYYYLGHDFYALIPFIRESKIDCNITSLEEIITLYKLQHGE